jgi:hypothetical protein
MLGFPVHINDRDGRALAVSGMLAVTFFWTTVGIFLLELAAPLWVSVCFGEDIWPRVVPIVWWGGGPGLTLCLTVAYYLAIRTNCKRRAALSVLTFVVAYVLTVVAILLKSTMIYPNTA